jgi:uncharacterized protein YbbK (DUF523 family)
MIIISACLLGENCKYNGGNNACQWVIDFARAHECISVCPESFGNLPTPRPPSEIIEGRAIDKNGKNITEALKTGAVSAWKRAEAAAKETKIEMAILKANSPSCGCGKIYDGTFTGKLVDGDGFFTRLLKEKGIKAITEKETVKW